MATVTFNLKEPNAKSETLIYLIFRYNNVKFKYSTGQKIHPKYWNFETHLVREIRNIPFSEFNALLKTLNQLVIDTPQKATERQN